ncbi:MAG: T9SS type A sorting domain-containing protein [Cyclonatronaceae bacterium]
MNKIIPSLFTLLLFTASLSYSQNNAATLLPADIGATWSFDAIQTDSAGNEQFYSYQEMLDNIEGNLTDFIYTIDRQPGSAYQIRVHGDTLFTDIRSAISGLLPEGIDADSLDFSSPWVGFVRRDVAEGGDWQIVQLELKIPLPDDIKALFPTLATPKDTMDVFVTINGVRENNQSRSLAFGNTDVQVYTTVIDLTAVVYYLIFGSEQSINLPLIRDYEIRNEYAEGLGLVHRKTDVYEVRATATVLTTQLDEYLFTIPGNESTMTSFSTGTSITDSGSETARRFELLQNYPNPFNPSTSIRFSLDRPGNVTLDVYSVNGQHIATLSDGVRYGSGLHMALFDGSKVASGIYLYRMQVVPDDGSGAISAVRRMTLIK